MNERRDEQHGRERFGRSGSERSDELRDRDDRGLRRDDEPRGVSAAGRADRDYGERMRGGVGHERDIYGGSESMRGGYGGYGGYEGLRGGHAGVNAGHGFGAYADDWRGGRGYDEGMRGGGRGYDGGMRGGGRGYDEGMRGGGRGYDEGMRGGGRGYDEGMRVGGRGYGEGARGREGYGGEWRSTGLGGPPYGGGSRDLGGGYGSRWTQPRGGISGQWNTGGSSERGEMPSHRGKGPKGFKRSDDRIREMVSEALSDHDDIDASELEVSVRDGEVTVSGTVTDRRTKRLIEDVIESVSGVLEVQNHARVRREQQAGATTAGGDGRNANVTPPQHARSH